MMHTAPYASRETPTKKHPTTFNVVVNHIYGHKRRLLRNCVTPQSPPTFAIRPVGLLAHERKPVLCQRALMCKHNVHVAAIRDFYYRLSNPLYIAPIGEITAITSVPTTIAINTIINGSIAASTLCVVISTSSS